MRKVIVQSLSDYNHAMLVTGGGRAFVIDEPVEEGGDNLGPTPYELLAAALAGCTAMTIQIYARRRKIPVLEVAVEVEHNRIHAKDCVRCIEKKEGRIEVFHRNIVVRGPITDAQRDQLLAVAARCPVHKTLGSALEVLDSIEVVE